MVWRGGVNVSAYEKDTKVKIPNWYLKFPQKTLDKLSDFGLYMNRILPCPKKKRSKESSEKRDVEFYL